MPLKATYMVWVSPRFGLVTVRLSLGGFYRFRYEAQVDMDVPPTENTRSDEPKSAPRERAITIALVRTCICVAVLAANATRMLTRDRLIDRPFSGADALMVCLMVLFAIDQIFALDRKIKGQEYNFMRGPYWYIASGVLFVGGLSFFLSKAL